MSNCKDCRWWERVDIEPDYQRSDDVALVRNWGLCALTKSDMNEPRTSSSLAFASNEGYETDADQDRSVLVTAPDFGCVQFEAREV